MVKAKGTADVSGYSAVGAMMSAVGATLLIVTEMLGAAFAFAWAVSGLLGMGTTAKLVLMAIVAVPGLIASLGLARRILKVENTLRAGSGPAA